MTQVPIGATPWPNGTSGRYGLKIDPSLSSNLPSYVGGNPLVEDANTEAAALDDQGYASALDAFYAARVGQVTNPNWVLASVAQVKDGVSGPDFYAAWRDNWFTSACSQAGGVASKSQESINAWQVDVASCGGGVRAYTFSPSDGILISIMDLGPRNLARELIQVIQ
jgi:hypothetical protein